MQKAPRTHQVQPTEQRQAVGALQHGDNPSALLPSLSLSQPVSVHVTRHNLMLYRYLGTASSGEAAAQKAQVALAAPTAPEQQEGVRFCLRLAELPAELRTIAQNLTRQQGWVVERDVELDAYPWVADRLRALNP